MKTSRLFAAATVAATAAVLASCAAGIRKDDLVGIWVQPVPGMAMVQVIELKEIDASASEFGKDYDGTFQVLRIISISDN